jgi:hypothetical protein
VKCWDLYQRTVAILERYSKDDELGNEDIEDDETENDEVEDDEVGDDGVGDDESESET